jgi:hypothetical protein
MKPIKFITTFSKTGYEVYGKQWIDSFSANVEEQDITVDLYIDFPLSITDKRINIVNYDRAIPNHKSWLTEFNSLYTGAMYNKKMAMRFSYKSFVMQHALQNNSNCYIIWLDGDCIFKPNQTYNNLSNILDNKFIAVQREHNGGADHCESGFVLFDVDHKDKDQFLNVFIETYNLNTIINQDSPYDGFMIYKSLANVDYVDLNKNYGKGGIQSDPSCTFLNPILQSRFIHNIGVTGKSQYESWNTYSKTDEYFKLIQNKTKKTPEDIRRTRLELINRRNEMRKPV